ncbi:MAG: pyridoxal phosphate-dependent aminotransferase [Pseudomonadota bacterium]
MSGPRYTRLAASLPASVPFVGPETQERARGRPFLARLGANENPFGPSPRAVAAMERAAREAWMYGDPENRDLKDAIAARHGIDPAHVVVGEGIDGLLGYLVRLLVEPGDPVVTSDGAYPTFGFHVAGYGGTLDRVPYAGDREDPAALAARAAATGARLIYLANPDNPMGTWWSGPEIARAVASVPDGTLLALDEAYIDLAPDGTAPDIDPADPRVIRLRTFSKGFGLAGARVGYAICEKPLAAAFDKVRNHFGLSRVSQAAALAALSDGDWLAGVRVRVAEARDRIAAIVRDHDLEPLPSAANFVTVDCGRGGAFARAVLNALLARGVFVRMPFVAPHDRCIRISCGRDEDLAVFAAALPGALAEARASAPA